MATVDPLLGDTPEDLHALRAHMAESTESTLLSLSEWIADHQPHAA